MIKKIDILLISFFMFFIFSIQCTGEDEITSVVRGKDAEKNVLLVKEIINNANATGKKEKAIAINDWIGANFISNCEDKTLLNWREKLRGRCGLCQEVSIIMKELLAIIDIPSRVISVFDYNLDHPEYSHALCEAYYNREWHLFDPTFGAFYTYLNENKILSFSELVEPQKEVTGHFYNTWRRVQMFSGKKRLNLNEFKRVTDKLRMATLYSQGLTTPLFFRSAKNATVYFDGTGFAIIEFNKTGKIGGKEFGLKSKWYDLLPDLTGRMWFGYSEGQRILLIKFNNLVNDEAYQLTLSLGYLTHSSTLLLQSHGIVLEKYIYNLKETGYLNNDLKIKFKAKTDKAVIILTFTQPNTYLYFDALEFMCKKDR